MNCRRSEELWTDYVDGTLAPPLESELRSHFGACRACAELFSCFETAVAGLEISDSPAIPDGLTERILARGETEMALRRRQRDRVISAPAPPLGQTASWIAVAAALAFILLWRPPGALSEWSRKTSQSVHQAYSYGVRTYHQSERWVEELNVLRMTVGVAFEDRLEDINRRLRDLEEASRRTDERPEQSRRKSASPGLSAHAAKSSQTRSHL